MTSKPILTADGSYTLRHPDLGELYHARDGAVTEARVKFIQPGQLAERRRTGPVRILDIGFGLGINVLEALAVAGPHPLHIDSLESDPAAIERALELDGENPILLDLRDHLSWSDSLNSVRLMPGDLRRTLPDLTGPYDLIFHDPFQPLVNTEAWTVEVFAQEARVMHPDGALLTYSQSKVVRAGLVQAGLHLFETPAVPPHRGGTAAFKRLPNSPGLTPVAIETTVIPWEDSTFNASAPTIRSERERRVRENVARHLH